MKNKSVVAVAVAEEKALDLKARQAEELAKLGYTPKRIAQLEARQASVETVAPIAQEEREEYKSKWTDLRDITKQIIAELRVPQNARITELAEFLEKSLNSIESNTETGHVTKCIQLKLLLNLVQINPSFWFIQTKKKTEKADYSQLDMFAQNATNDKSKKNTDQANHKENNRAKILWRANLPEMTAVENLLEEFNIAGADKITTPVAKCIITRQLLQQNNEVLRATTALKGEEKPETTGENQDPETLPKIGALPLQQNTIKSFYAFQKQSNSLAFAGEPARSKWQSSLYAFWLPLIDFWKGRDLARKNTAQSRVKAEKLFRKAYEMTEQANLQSDIVEELAKLAKPQSETAPLPQNIFA